MTTGIESGLNVFATGVEWSIYLSVMAGMLFGTLRIIRRFLGVGRDV